MKILLSGAQGTGKSTIVHQLKNRPDTAGLEIIDSMSKIFLTDSKDIQVDYENKDYIDFQTKITIHHLDNMINKDNYICSRSIADSYAYMTYARRNIHDMENYDILEALLDITEVSRKIQSTHNDVYNIYVPIMFDLSQDNNENRLVDKEYQEKIDSLIKFYYTSNKIDFLELKSLGIEDRIQEILHYINTPKEQGQK
jgi:guanylate kinase